MVGSHDVSQLEALGVEAGRVQHVVQVEAQGGDVAAPHQRQLLSTLNLLLRVLDKIRSRFKINNTG